VDGATGTTKRSPSVEATSPPPHRRARSMPFWAATSVEAEAHVITAALANQIEIGVIQVEEARELFR
jgi:hypothetical protein